MTKFAAEIHGKGKKNRAGNTSNGGEKMKHRTEFTEKELKSALFSNSEEAEDIVNDPEKMKSFQDKVKKWIEKGKKIPVLENVIDSIVLMVELLDDYRTKEYTQIPIKSLLAIVAGLIYVISPIDLIPDVVPFVGYIDDVAIIMLVLEMISSDLDDYRAWRKSKTESARKSLRNGVVREIIERIGTTTIIAGAFFSERNTISILTVEDKDNSDEKPIGCHAIEENIPFKLLSECNITSEDDIVVFYKDVFDDGAFRWSVVGKIPFQIETDYKEYNENFLII